MKGVRMAIDKQSKKKQSREAAIAVIKKAVAEYEATFICRDKVEGFTGGAIKARHLANLDSLGQGPEGAFKVGRRQCYPIDSFCNWLISRLEV
jgi:hypothetical protein